MELNIKGRRIILRQGDITEQNTEAIVNAANNQLWMGAGVAGAVKRRGGKEIEDEAVKYAPIPVGEAVVTKGGRLKARYVIHAAVMGEDLITDEEKIKAATENSLKRALELGLKSISFPALGTGVGGFPVGKAASVMLKVTWEHLNGETTLQDVYFVLFDEVTFRSFAKELRRYAKS